MSKKIYFTCNWGEKTKVLTNRMNWMTFGNSGIWNNKIIVTTKLKEADYVIAFAGIGSDVKNFDNSKIILFQRDPNRFNTKNYILDTTYRHYCREDIITPPKYPIHEGHIGPEGQKSWAEFLYKELQDRKIIGDI